jgi:hypothetical protein
MNNLFQAAESAQDTSSNGTSISSFDFGVTNCKFKSVSLSEGNETISPSIIFTFAKSDDEKKTHDYVVWPPFAREGASQEESEKAEKRFFATVYMLLNRFEKDVDENGQYNSKEKFMTELQNAGFTRETDASADIMLFMRPAYEAISKIIDNSPFKGAEFQLKVTASVYNNKKRLATPAVGYTHFLRIGEKVITELMKISKKEQESYNEYLNFKDPNAAPATSAGQKEEEDAF